MAGRTAAEAVNNFLEPLSRVLSCVTDSILNVGGGYHPSPSSHVMLLADGGPIRLAGSQLALRIIHHYRVIEAPDERGPWKVSTAGYLYSLEDLEGHELLAYHWHPTDPNPIKTPHLHLGAASGVSASLAEAHFPTGRIAIEDFVRLLIRDLGVAPRRDDWPEVLDQAQEAFNTWRTW